MRGVGRLGPSAVMGTTLVVHQISVLGVLSTSRGGVPTPPTSHFPALRRSRSDTVGNRENITKTTPVGEPVGKESVNLCPQTRGRRTTRHRFRLELQRQVWTLHLSAPGSRATDGQQGPSDDGPDLGRSLTEDGRQVVRGRGTEVDVRWATRERHR